LNATLYGIDDDATSEVGPSATVFGGACCMDVETKHKVVSTDKYVHTPDDHLPDLLVLFAK